MIVLRGAGPCFSSGYDLSGDNSADLPYATARGDGFWPRHVVDGAFRIWDLRKPGPALHSLKAHAHWTTRCGRWRLCAT